MTSSLHETAVKLAETYKTSECALLDILIQMAEKNLFIQLGFLDMFDYLVKALGLSECQSGYFSRVAQRARTIPELKEAVVSGRLKLSQARRICGVIESSNCLEWIALASTLSQRQLEERVAQVRPRVKVHEGIKLIAAELNEMKVALSLEEEAMVKRIQDLVSQRLKKPATLQETIREMALCYLNKFDPVKKAERALSTAQSLRTQVPPEVKSQPGSHQIKAALKHQVHLRDGFRCIAKDEKGNRCHSERWLSLHHLKLVSQGGQNSLDNLVTVCNRHHAMAHLNHRRLQFTIPNSKTQ